MRDINNAKALELKTEWLQTAGINRPLTHIPLKIRDWEHTHRRRLPDIFPQT